jgi:DNA-binding transcriptional MerR regulator
MSHYRPAQVRAALGLQAVTLHTWHNSYGLAVGRHQPNGHRRYDLADVAALNVVVRLGGDGGFIQHRAVIALANDLRPLLADHLARFARYGADLLVKMDEARPGVACRPHDRHLTFGWDLKTFETRDDGAASAIQAAGGFGVLVIDFADLIRATVIALDVAAGAAGND